MNYNKNKNMNTKFVFGFIDRMANLASLVNWSVAPSSTNTRAASLPFSAQEIRWPMKLNKFGSWYSNYCFFLLQQDPFLIDFSLTNWSKYIILLCVVDEPIYVLLNRMVVGRWQTVTKLWCLWQASFAR